jgi:nitrite reductase/ring-hydroxylating ferredoxin subunit
MLREDDWVSLMPAADVPEGDLRYVEAEGIRLLVHHVGDAFFVTSSQCPHEEFTMDRCALDGPVITCTEHGWKMDVRTGHVVDVGDEDACLPTYPAEVRDGWVWAKLF